MGEPGAEVKTQPPGDKFRGRPPFQTCFVLRQEPGRSLVSPSRPRRHVPTVTTKFYSRHDVRELCDVPADFLSRVDRSHVDAVRNASNQPLLESQRYGRYTEPLVDLDQSDRRLHHAKNTSQPIRLQYLINVTKPALK